MASQVGSRGYIQATEATASKHQTQLRKIYVAGLLAKTTAQECLEYFSQFGRIDGIQEINTANATYPAFQSFKTGQKPSVSSFDNMDDHHHKSQGTSKKHMLLTVRDKATYDSILSVKHYLNSKPLFCAPYHTGSQLMRHNRLSNQRRVILRCLYNKGMLLDQISSLLGPVETIYGFDGSPALKLSQKLFGSFSVLLASREAALALIEAKTLTDPQTGTILTVEAFKTHKKKKQPHPDTDFPSKPVTMSDSVFLGQPSGTRFSPNLSDFSSKTHPANPRPYLDASSRRYLLHSKRPLLQAEGLAASQEKSSWFAAVPSRARTDSDRYLYFDAHNLGSKRQLLVKSIECLDHSRDNLRFNCVPKRVASF